MARKPFWSEAGGHGNRWEETRPEPRDLCPQLWPKSATLRELKNGEREATGGARVLLTVSRERGGALRAVR